MPLAYQRTRQLLQSGGCIYGTSKQCDKGGLTVVVLGEPSGDPLQHPRMAQVHAIEAHELALGWVGHPHWFEPLGSNILVHHFWLTIQTQCTGVAAP